MIKYVIVACLCLMLVVERDVDTQDMLKAPGFPGQFVDMAKNFKEGMTSAMSAMSDVISQAKDAMNNGSVRRRRDLQ